MNGFVVFCSHLWLHLAMTSMLVVGPTTSFFLMDANVNHKRAPAVRQYLSWQALPLRIRKNN